MYLFPEILEIELGEAFHHYFRKRIGIILQRLRLTDAWSYIDYDSYTTKIFNFSVYWSLHLSHEVILSFTKGLYGSD